LFELGDVREIVWVARHDLWFPPEGR
jgi:hypothetical protein